MFGYDPANVILCSDSAACSFWHPIVFSAIVLFIIVTGFAYTTLLERKFIAFFQQRVGPNRVGPGGFLQPAADGLKLIFKEDIIPEQAYKAVYYIAPVLKAVPVLIVGAVIPWGPPVNIPWLDGNWYRIPLHLADLNVGILWILAITSIATYGVVLAGWSSNNKYAMLGGLRASAQMISYELSMGLTMAVPVMIVGSMSIGDIVAAQLDAPPILGWFVFQNPLAAGILMIALLAEVSRSPFDLPEAEQELTQGFMTEYSAMRFALFMMAEYLGMIAVSMVAVSLYFGGWGIGGGFVENAPLLAPLVFIGKVILFLIGMVWVRATLPRFRYDRLMMFGWKVMLPLSIVAVAWTGVAVVIGETASTPVQYAIASAVFVVIALIAGSLVLRRESTETPVRSLANDPMVTGERTGIAHILVEVLGWILAIPYNLFDKSVAGLTQARKNVARELRDFASHYGKSESGD